MSLHFSDLPSSSVHEGDTSDPFYFGFPPDSQLFTPENLASQTASVINSDFTQPLPTPPIPDGLQRVGPDRHRQYVLYTTMSRDAFVAWWLMTEYGTRKRINWGTNHQSECWKQFEQVADIKTGKPMVMCKVCAAILEHPALCRHGTSSMNKHIKGPACRRSTKRPSIKQMMEDAVSSISLSVLYKILILLGKACSESYSLHPG
jgi:hypothetical protein